MRRRDANKIKVGDRVVFRGKEVGIHGIITSDSNETNTDRLPRFLIDEGHYIGYKALSRKEDYKEIR